MHFTGFDEDVWRECIEEPGEERNVPCFQDGPSGQANQGGSMILQAQQKG